MSGVEHEHLASPIFDPIDEDLDISATESQEASKPCNTSRPRPLILFAGEATTAYHPSTIHGAYLSGIREAHRLDFAVAPKANDNADFEPDAIYRRTFQIRKQLNPSPTYSADTQRQLLYGSGVHIDTDDQKSEQVLSPIKQQSLDKRRPGLRIRRHMVRDVAIVNEAAVQSRMVRKPAVQNRSSRRTVRVKSYCELEKDDSTRVVETSEGSPATARQNGKQSAVSDEEFTLEEDRALLRGADSYGMDSKGLNLIHQKMGLQKAPKVLLARYKALVKAGSDLFIPELDAVTGSQNSVVSSLWHRRYWSGGKLLHHQCQQVHRRLKW